MSASLSYGDYVAIIYASLQTCGLLSTSLYVLLKSSSSGCFARLKEIWSYKWIYVSSLSTIYDQATDIGVLIYWYSLIGNNNIKHVDMMLLFVLSCVFISISRLMNAFLGFALVKSKVLGIFLGMFDLLITSLVWHKVTGSTNVFTQMNKDQDELTDISWLQFCEIFLETLPQILLQSLFLTRTFGNSVVYQDDNVFNVLLVWISLFISVLSATNKISHSGLTGGNVSEREAFENKYSIRLKCPIINIGVLSKKIFYILTTITRLFIYSLLWSVCGGLFVTLFFVICFVVYVICVKRGVYDTDDSLVNICGGFWLEEAFGFGDDNMHTSSGRKQFAISNACNFFGLSLIFYFGMDNSFDCNYNLCADKTIRSFNHNTFVRVLFFATTCAFLVHIVLYLFIPKFVQLSKTWEDNYQNKKQTRKSNANTTK